MQKNLLFFIAIFFLVVSCKVQEKAFEEAIPSFVPTEKSLLWEISGNGLENVSYLFGTIHLIPEEDFFFPDVVDDALAATARATFEINMEDMFDLSSYFSLFSKAFMPNGITLRDLLSEEDYNVVADHFETIGIPFMLLDRIKPMFLSVFTEGDLDADGLFSGSVISYEMEIYRKAQDLSHEFAGLETVEFQMSMFDSIPYEAQAEMLVESIRMSDVEGSQFREMVEIYKRQDINSMQDLLNSGEDSIGQYQDLLLNNRNRNWIPIMEQMMTEKSTFFAVGAGHLGGEVGVVALLRKAGYSLKPLSHIIRL